MCNITKLFCDVNQNWTIEFLKSHLEYIKGPKLTASKQMTIEVMLDKSLMHFYGKQKIF